MSANPYAPPESLIVTEKSAADARARVLRAFAWLGAGVAVFAMAVVVAMASSNSGLGTLGLLVAALVSAVGTVRSVLALAHALRSPKRAPWVVAGGVVAAVANLGMAALGALAAFLSTVTFSRGRQLRSFGRVLLAPLAPAGAWSEDGARLHVHVEDDARAALAERWRENGRTEHASVAAFARLTLDLMALGAPPSLVAAAQRDALDEIEHAELCFSLARALDGKATSPGPFPRAARARTLPQTRALALAALAVDSLVDGALHEGVSARAVAVLARRCSEPTIQAALRRIAADEGRHAAHGWDVVEWCLAEGGDAVASALRGAVVALPLTMRTPLPPRAADGTWEKWGIVGHGVEQEQYARARAYVCQRVTQWRRAAA
jgi:hypothetical protein